MFEVANDSARERLSTFVRHCEQLDATLAPAGIAFGVECALASKNQVADQSIDLVWTGPGTSSVSVRRSAAVLLELIRSARTEIGVVSFASFRVADALLAFQLAAERGVTVQFILESEEDSNGRLSQHGLSPFAGLRSHPRVEFYRWPFEKRPPHALLHAKAVVVDREQALVTSANLTENAISSNIEIGVLIRGGDVPRRISEHIASLIDAGEFCRVE